MRRAMYRGRQLGGRCTGFDGEMEGMMGRVASRMMRLVGGQGGQTRREAHWGRETRRRTHWAQARRKVVCWAQETRRMTV